MIAEQSSIFQVVAPASLRRVRWSVSERRLLLLLGDLTVVIGAMLGSQLVGNSFPAEAGWTALWVLLLTGLWLAIGQVFNVYDLALAARLRRALPRVAAAAVATMSLYSLVPYWSPPLPTSRLLIGLHLALLFVPLLAWRAGYALFLTRPAFRVRTIIVGHSRTTIKLARLLKSGDDHGYDLVGVVDSRREPSADDASLAEQVISLVKAKAVQEVIVDDVGHLHPGLAAPLLELAERGISVLPASEAYEAITGRCLLQRATVLGLGHQSASTRAYAVMRRVVDLTVAGIGLVALAPLLVIAALGIVLESRGSPLYRQVRTGRYGRQFQILKLRTMVANAEADGRPVWASDPDPRVTRFGYLLRRSRLDEVPQLWNVVRGEMSLIGPRPERPEFVALLTSSIPLYRARHAIAPGITGWAQVQYKYGSSIKDAATKLQYDLYYLRHRSVVLDALILLRTLKVVLRFKGI